MRLSLRVWQNPFGVVAKTFYDVAKRRVHRLVEALLISWHSCSVVAIVLLATVLRGISRDPATPLAPKIDALAGAQERAERLVQEELKRNREENAGNARHLREEVGASIKGMSDSVEKRVNEMRGVVDVRLQQIQQESGKKLEQMRETVDEKLQGTLEKRLGESFQLVSERLEAVHKGLGEMQTPGHGVGDLKKVLTNVKSRGTWGEVQLGRPPGAGADPRRSTTSNVATKPGSSERVEFAIRLPGPRRGRRQRGAGCPSTPSSPRRTTCGCSEAYETRRPGGAGGGVPQGPAHRASTPRPRPSATST